MTPFQADQENIRKLRAANRALVAACKKAMHCLTAEREEEWMVSQEPSEAPYHFLREAIVGAKGMT